MLKTTIKNIEFEKPHLRQFGLFCQPSCSAVVSATSGYHSSTSSAHSDVYNS